MAPHPAMIDLPAHSAPAPARGSSPRDLTPPELGRTPGVPPAPPSASCRALLLERDLIAEGQRDALRLRADADVAGDPAVGRALLDRHVHEGGLAKVGACVQVGREEARLSTQRRRRRQALHVGRAHHVIEELVHVSDVRVDGHLVLPLELGPHRAEGEVRARRWRDVVHDVDVDVVQHDARAVGVRGAGGVVHDRAEDDARLGGGDLDVGADRARLARCEGVRLRPLAQLEVAHRRELEREVGHHLGRLVDHEHVEDDVVLVHRHKRLGVHRVGQARELCDSFEPLRKVLGLGAVAREGRELDVVIVGVELYVGRAALQLADVEQRIDLPHRGGGVGLRDRRPVLAERAGRARLGGRVDRRLLGLGRLLLGQHLREGRVALLEEVRAHLVRWHREQLQARRETVGRVEVHPLLGGARAAQSQHRNQDGHHVGSHQVGYPRVGDVLARAERELGQCRARHGGEEEVAAHDQLAQLEPGRAAKRASASACTFAAGACVRRAARDGRGRVRAVGEHGGAHRRGAGGLALRLRALGCRCARLALGDQRQRAQRALDGLEGARHLLGRVAKLAEQPERDAKHTRRVDGGEDVERLGDDRRAQLRVHLHDLAHEEGHVERARLVLVGEEVHQHRHDRLRHVGELDGARMDRVDEQLVVLGGAGGRGLVLRALRARDLLLQRVHHLADVPRRDEVERDVQALLADVEVGARQRAHHVHHHLLQHARVFHLELLQALEHDELDVVVTLSCEERGVARRRRLDRCGGRGEGDERGRALVQHRVRRRVEEREDAPDVLALLVRIAAAHLADELEHDELEQVAVVRDLLQVVREEGHGALLRAVEQHQERVALAGHVRLGVQQRVDQLGRVGHQPLEVAVDGVRRQNRRAPHVRVPVLEVRLDRRHEWLEQLGLSQLAQEAQRRAADVLVGVLQIVAKVVTHEDHLRQ
mmetsp:Transcript_10832/g.28114  ORF Transcript_10832/g.28114 Transcript_10832/m.28114 type:complete len:938 (-) Transcript_10832:320-3133(-)